jgi:hypothetical protein
MAAIVRQMFARGSGDGAATVTIDLGAPTAFLAWGSITSIDSLADFDRDNAAAIDIPYVDGVRTNDRLSGGGHWGIEGAYSNLYQGALVSTGRTVTFRLRAFHAEDLACFGYGIIITNP